MSKESYSGDRIISISRGAINFVVNDVEYRVTGEALLRSFGSDIDFLVDKNSIRPEPGPNNKYIFSVLASLLEDRGMAFEIS